MTEDDRKIVAVALLTEGELRGFARELKEVYPLPNDRAFDDLLQRIEQASRSKR